MAEATENKLLQDVIKTETAAHELPTHLPVLPLSDVVVFPHMVAPLLVSNAQSIQLIDEVVAGSRLLAVTLQTDPDLEQPRPDQLLPNGCVARVMRMLKFPDDSVRVLIQGLKRMRIVRVESDKPYLQAEVAPLDDELDPTLVTSALARNAGNLFQEIINLSPSLPDELKVAVVNIEDPSKLADVIAANLNIPLQEKQRLLEAVSVKTRLTLLTNLLNREVEVLHLGTEIQSKVNTALSRSQREYFLREQLKAIQKELGETGEGSEVGELRDKIDKAKMPAKQAETVLDLLHGFSEDDLTHPITYQALLVLLGSDRLAIRGLAYWHLSRLAPDGRELGYDPLAPKEKRQAAIKKWQKLIPPGKVPASGWTGVK